MKLSSRLPPKPNLMKGGSVPLQPLYSFVVKEGIFYIYLLAKSRKQYNRKDGYYVVRSSSKVS